MASQDIHTGIEFARAIAAHFKLPGTTDPNMEMVTGANEVFSIKVKLMLTADDLAAIANLMPGRSTPAPIGASTAAPKSEYFAAAVASGFSSGPYAKLSEFLGTTDTVPAAVVTPQVASLAMAPGDALVLTTQHQLSREQLAAMKQRICSDLGADVRMLIIDGGVSLAVLTGLPAAGDGATGD